MNVVVYGVVHLFVLYLIDIDFPKRGTSHHRMRLICINCFFFFTCHYK